MVPDEPPDLERLREDLYRELEKVRRKVAGCERFRNLVG